MRTACAHEIPYPQLNRGSERAEVQTVATAQAEDAEVQNEANNERQLRTTPHLVRIAGSNGVSSL
jgi:hypothetical protein